MADFIHLVLALIVAGLWQHQTVESHDPYPRLEHEPPDQTVYPGDNAMFECDLINVGVEDIIWFHHETDSYLTDDVLIASHRDNRYIITGNTSSDSYRLWIFNVQMEDAGTYACIWKGRCSLPMAWMKLTVVGAPKDGDDDDSSSNDGSNGKLPPDNGDISLNPICEMSFKTRAEPSEDSNHNIGDEIILICKSPNGVPHSTVEWYRNGVDSLAGPFPTNIGYQRYLNHDDWQATFTCVMKSPFIRGSHNCTVGPMLLSVSEADLKKQSVSSSDGGSHALASIAATLGICCVILVAAVGYILFNKTKTSKRQHTIAAISPTVTAAVNVATEGYLSLNTQHNPPQYQQLKSPPNGKLLRTIQPPPRKPRVAKATRLSSATGNQTHIYAAPKSGHQSTLQAGRLLSRSEDSIHTYEFPT